MDSSMLDNLHRTKEMGHRSHRLLESGDLDAYARLMHEHWLNKRARSLGMSSDRADLLYDAARNSGALGGKLVGAGGGGFLLVYSEDVERTRQTLAELDSHEVRFSFDFQGCVGSEQH
jgi:D-glycero-alpha-D-manno-heptose-7-phosphate kinase